MGLEASIQDILQILKSQQQTQGSTSSPISNVRDIGKLVSLESQEANSPKLQRDEIKGIEEPETPKTEHPSIAYRCYSPNYEEGLRREVQSRSRSNTIDSSTSLSDIDQD